MSTKIYNGLKLHISSLSELAEWRRDICTRFEADAITRLNRKLSEDAVGVADSLQVLPQWGLPKPKHNTEYGGRGHALGIARKKLEGELKESETYCERDHFQLEMTLFPIVGKDFILAIPHNNSRTISAWIKTQPKVEEFPYWNNSDEPRGISNKEWKARGELWDEAMPNSPAEDGLLLKTQNPQHMLYSMAWHPEKYRLQPPDKKTRARRLARAILEQKMLAPMIRPNIRGSQIMEIMERVARHPGRKNLARIIERTLPTYFRWQDLARIPVETQLKKS